MWTSWARMRILAETDPLEVARYILEDEEIEHDLEIPNETTLKAFAEDKNKMPVFHPMDELRKDLLLRGFVLGV